MHKSLILLALILAIPTVTFAEPFRQVAPPISRPNRPADTPFTLPTPVLNSPPPVVTSPTTSPVSTRPKTPAGCPVIQSGDYLNVQDWGPIQLTGVVVTGDNITGHIAGNGKSISGTCFGGTYYLNFGG